MSLATYDASYRRGIARRHRKARLAGMSRTFRHALVKLLAHGPMKLLVGSRGGQYGIESDENGQRIKTDTARKLHRLGLVEFSIRDNGVFLTLSDRGRAVAATLSEEK